MLHWIPYAFVRITITYILGLLTGIYFPALGSGIFILKLAALLAVLYSLLLIIIRKHSFLKYNLMLSATAFSIFYALGLGHSLIKSPLNSENHIVNQKNIEAYTGIIQAPGEPKTKTTQYNLYVNAIKSNEGWRKAKGEVLLYVDTLSDLLVYGDEILVSKRPPEIQKPSNPNQFDYRTYINREGIYHQQYLTSNDFEIIGRDHTNPFIQYAYKTREWAVSVFDERIKGEQERAIIQALILGYKHNLSDDTKKAYADAGTMHILAVSGLHVGIIYTIFYWLLSRWRTGNKSRWLFGGVVVVFLWFYAAVTGFSPSVIRAVTMFSFIAIADASVRKTNIYNTLSAAALALLLYDPQLILSVGFQLSFLAVLGIVYLQPKIYNWWLVENWLLEKAWSWTTVAIAVQIATFPLGLYYFHQFPSYFFLSNLAAIPGAFLTLVSGLGLMAVSWIPLVSDIVAFILENIVWALNATMAWLEILPLNKIDQISINLLDLLLIYIFTWTIVFTFTLRKYVLIYITIITASVFAIIQSMKVESLKETNILTIYDMGKVTSVEFMSQQTAFIYGDSLTAPNTKNFQYNISPNHIANHVKEVRFEYIGTSDQDKENHLSLIEHRDKKILIISKKIPTGIRLKNRAQVDYILLTKNAKASAEWIKENFSFDKIILDGSLNYWRYVNFKEQFASLNINYYSIRDDGAFVEDL